MVNKDSSVGVVEDLLTNIMQLVASEYHLQILVRKYEDQLMFWYGDSVESGSDEELEVLQVEDDLFNTRILLMEATNQRRKAMKLLKSKQNRKGNSDLWCLLKHILGATITAFEVWQVDFKDENLRELFLEQSRVANQVVGMFLGYEVTPCSACLTEQMKEVENNE